jgi:hypothetical protein
MQSLLHLQHSFALGMVRYSAVCFGEADIEEPRAKCSDLAGGLRVVPSLLGVVRAATYSLISVTTFRLCLERR